MRFLLTVLAAGALVGSAFSTTDAREEALGHVAGLVHHEPGDDGHAHGDADDRHESPESPCHHHDVHSCVDGGPAVATSDSAIALGHSSERFIALESPLIFRPVPRPTFHVPLA